VAASPVQPACGVAGRVAALGGGGEQAPDLGDGQRDLPGVRRRAWSGVTGAGAWVSVRSLSWAAVTAQIARADMTSTTWRRIAGYSLAWHSSGPKQSWPDLKSSSAGYLSPAALIRRVLVSSWPSAT
jgi:hypothetical protein